MLRDARAGSLNLDSPGAGGTGHLPGGSFGAGNAASPSNPYWFIWWTTVGAGYVVLSSREHGFAGALLFYSGHILSDLAWFSLLALAATTGRRLITPALYRVIMALLGAFLIIFALSSPGRGSLLSTRPSSNPSLISCIFFSLIRVTYACGTKKREKGGKVCASGETDPAEAKSIFYVIRPAEGG